MYHFTCDVPDCLDELCDVVIPTVWPAEEKRNETWAEATLGKSRDPELSREEKKPYNRPRWWREPRFRETDIVIMRGQGLTCREIGLRLGLPTASVETVYHRWRHRQPGVPAPCPSSPVRGFFVHTSTPSQTDRHVA